MKTKCRSHTLFKRSTVLAIIFFPLLIILFSSTVSCKPEPQPELKPLPETVSEPESETATTRASEPSPDPVLPTGPNISGGRTIINKGEIATYNITIDGVMEGISGYDLTISVADEEVTQIVDVVLPYFGLTDISELPSNTVTIMAVDLKDIVTPGKGKTLLATLKIQGIGLGTSNIDVVVNAMDDDDGNPIEPYVASGTIEVR